MSWVKILGIDYGKKRIGLAMSVPGISFALAYKVLEMGPTGVFGLIETIKEIIGQEQITALVLGLPKQLDNNIGLAGREVIQFADELKKNIEIPLVLWDERFTSKQAEVLLRDVNMSHKDKRQQINVTAAQVMLQSYLDAQASQALADEPLPDEEEND